MSLATRPALRRIGAATCAAVALAGTSVLASPARADTAPVPPETTPTVSSDALPTVQVNGVAWDQVVVGNRVYATGQFTSARPAGSAAGTNQTPRSNILAYDLTTGALVTSWAPSLNAQGLALAASPDGTRIYVGGDFTSVSGVTRNRIAALDATTGAVVSSFAASVSSRVRDIAVSGSTVYVGGTFTTAAGQARSRLAAFTAATGALTTWAPVADAEAMALVAPAGSGKVVVGGRFFALNGVDYYGMGALDATTGQTLPWAATSVVRNAGPHASINSLSTDGTHVYGTGYTYLVVAGSEDDGNFEGTFAAAVDTGELSWVTGCRGDTYSAAPVSGVLYSVGHPHDCGMIGGNPQTEPWTFQHAVAQTVGPDPGGAVNTYGFFTGHPAPQVLHWLPTLSIGSYTGQSQAAWSVSGNSQYVVLGGEFPRVNGVGQQGLARFAVKGVAPNREGPQGAAELKPGLVSLAPGSVRVSWKAAWDRDNRQLTYEVLRGATVAGSTVIATRQADATWWNRPPLAFTDTTAAPGTTQTYRIRVRDPFGNTVTSSSTAITVPGGTAAPSPYRNAVTADGPTALWPLGESSGTTGYDWAGADDLVMDGSAQRGAAGPLLNETTTSTTFPGNATVPARSTTLTTAPQTFSVEAWIRTTTTSGGKIVGFGDNASDTSNTYDRHLYMTNSGAIVFGVYPGGVRTVSSGAGLNDGLWHHLVGTLGNAGQELYVDGKRVGRRTDTTSAQPFSGYWRVAGDNLNGWPDQPGSFALAGDVANVAVYPGALSSTRVQAHYTASGRSLAVPVKPADAYGGAVWDGQPDLYWRLDETSGSTAKDTMTNESGAIYSGGVALGQPGSPAAETGRSVTLPGGPQTVVASSPTSNPQVYSMEFWFKTTTTTGGRLMGFGNAPSGSASGNYDRHVYMFDDGRLRYGVWVGFPSVIDTAQSYNDGNWHHVVATLGGDGQRLYVDGSLAGSEANTSAENYTGYWRLGSDNTWGGSSTNDFSGSLDEVAVYPTVLSAATVQQHWAIATGTAPNQAPTAAFTSSAQDLTVSVDGSGSSDPDGSIASYAWQFGDGGTATGATAQHTYASAGTYQVTLTVTDDDGAIGTRTSSVTVTAPPGPNTPPTAAFTGTTSDLTASFNGSGSSDPDGSIASYAWQFGDGGTATGATAQHTYASAGTYQVTLTVTDDDGATGSATQAVTVTAPPANPVVAQDTFSRTVASGFGTAETGGAWTTAGTGASFSVADGSARASVSAGRTAKMRLNAASVQDVDLVHAVWLEQAATGGGAYLTTLVRTTSTGEYGAKVRVQSTGAVSLQLTSYVGGAETVLTNPTTVPGITYTPGMKLWVRVQAIGASPTTLRAKVWADGGTEPAAWLQTVTDSTSGLQAAGGVGFGPYTSGSATTPALIRYDNLKATRQQ